MLKIELSRHAQARMRQRGLRNEDILFVCEHGTDTGRGILLTTDDVANLEAEARHTLALAQRLKNVLVVINASTVKTAFRTSPSQQSRML